MNDDSFVILRLQLITQFPASNKRKIQNYKSAEKEFIMKLMMYLVSVSDIHCWSQSMWDCIISPQGIYTASPSLSGIVLYHHIGYTLLVPAYLGLYYITAGDIHC